MRVQRTDFASARLDAIQRTPQGGLRIAANLTREGVLTYSDGKGATWKEYRPEDEVFAADSLSSLRAAPVTDLHPQKLVTADSWRTDAVGHVCDDVARDGQFVTATVIVQDAAEVVRIDAGERKEVSCGYECDVDKTPGTTPTGERYDAVQRNIRYNHVALGPVGWGRAGPEVSLRMDGAAIEVQPAPEATNASEVKTNSGFANRERTEVREDAVHPAIRTAKRLYEQAQAAAREHPSESPQGRAAQAAVTRASEQLHGAQVHFGTDRESNAQRQMYETVHGAGSRPKLSPEIEAAAAKSASKTEKPAGEKKTAEPEKSHAEHAKLAAHHSSEAKKAMLAGDRKTAQEHLAKTEHHEQEAKRTAASGSGKGAGQNHDPSTGRFNSADVPVANSAGIVSQTSRDSRTATREVRVDTREGNGMKLKVRNVEFKLDAAEDLPAAQGAVDDMAKKIDTDASLLDSLSKALADAMGQIEIWKAKANALSTTAAPPPPPPAEMSEEALDSKLAERQSVLDAAKAVGIATEKDGKRRATSDLKREVVAKTFPSVKADSVDAKIVDTLFAAASDVKPRNDALAEAHRASVGTGETKQDSEQEPEDVMAKHREEQRAAARKKAL